MKFSHYIKRVETSSEFKKFKEKNPKAEICAGFFILDFEQGKHSHQIDYLLPKGKVATFILDEGIKTKVSDVPTKVRKKLKAIKSDSKLDVDTLKGIVEDEMKNRTVTENIKKIIAVLQIIDGRLVWNLNCILGGMGILQVHVDDKDSNVLKFEKHSILDFIRKI